MSLDFSQYATPTEEWLAAEPMLPIRKLPIQMGPQAMKAALNAERDARSAEAMKQFESRVRITDYEIPTRDGSTIEARVFHSVTLDASKKYPVFLYLHGGGFLLGTRHSDDLISTQIAIGSECVAVQANYRHTPEFTFPTAWYDTQDAFAWIHKNIDKIGGDASKVIVGGTSAGGNLSASLALEHHLGKSEATKGLPPIAGQLLIVPMLAWAGNYDQGPGKLLKQSSYVQNADAPILGKDTIEFLMELLKAGDIDLKDTKVNIVNATKDEVKGMPPTVFGIAGMDPLRDEGLLYAKTLAEAKVPTNITVFQGVPHGHMQFPHLKATKNFQDVLKEGIAWILSRPEATGKFEIKVPDA